MTYAADFTNGSAKRAPVLTLYTIANGRRSLVSSRSVADKRDARRIAKSLGFQPWNF